MFDRVFEYSFASDLSNELYIKGLKLNKSRIERELIDVLFISQYWSETY